jgi:hypothetical protein
MFYPILGIVSDTVLLRPYTLDASDSTVIKLALVVEWVAGGELLAKTRRQIRALSTPLRDGEERELEMLHSKHLKTTLIGTAPMSHRMRFSHRNQVEACIVSLDYWYNSVTQGRNFFYLPDSAGDIFNTVFWVDHKVMLAKAMALSVAIPNHRLIEMVEASKEDKVEGKTGEVWWGYFNTGLTIWWENKTVVLNQNLTLALLRWVAFVN